MNIKIKFIIKRLIRRLFLELMSYKCCFGIFGVGFVLLIVIMVMLVVVLLIMVISLWFFNCVEEVRNVRVN